MKKLIILVLFLACFYFAGKENQTTIEFVIAIASALIAIKLEKSIK